MFGSLAFVACEAEDGIQRSEDLGVFAVSETPARLEDESPVYFVEDDGTEGGRLVPSDIELIYEEIRVQDAADRELSHVTRGALTLEVWQRTSHPQFFMDASEPYLYHEEGGTTYLEDGTQRHTYRIRRQPNRSDADKPLTLPGPPQVDSLVMEAWAKATEEQSLELMVRLAGLPEFQPPPLPPKGLFPESEESRAQEIREAYLREHASRFAAAAAGFQTDVEAAGGRLLEVFPNIGWVSLTLPQEGMDTLVGHTGINRMILMNQPTEDCACNSSEHYDCSLNTPWWMLGEGRRNDRLDADKFLNAGIDGLRGNPDRHGHSRLLAGIVESGMSENESLALRTMDQWGTRLFVFDCAQNPCYYPQSPNELVEDWEQMIGGVLNWVEASNVTHGTSVTSVLAADFRLGQANGNAFGDHTFLWNWLNMTHCAEWVNASTGMAPGSAVIYANAAPDNSAAYIRAYDVMQEENVDVLNCSHKLGSGCNISSSSSTEDELENAYDDGILVIAASGNEGGGTNCNIVSPADTLKVIAVSSLDAELIACRSDYQDCVIDNEHASTGGMNATINGTTWYRVITGIDLVAPQTILNVTHAYNRTTEPNEDGPWPQDPAGVWQWPTGWNHDCNDSAFSGGSSIAAPHVSGLALLLKHWQLNKGNTFFNYPGRMQALLLAMGDRWSPDYSTRRVQGVSNYSGFGRIKLRHLDNANFAPRAFNSFAHSFYSYSSSLTNWAWPFKMPVGTNFVKCVLFEAEDMSVKSDVSDLYLNVNLKNPDANGNCSSSSTMFRSRINSTYDLRHMVAHEADVAGKCVEYQVIKRHATSTGSTAYGFCYYSSRYDYEDVAD